MNVNTLIDKVNSTTVPKSLECLCFDKIELLKHENQKHKFIRALKNRSNINTWYEFLFYTCYQYNHQTNKYDKNTNFEFYVGNLKYSSKTGYSMVENPEFSLPKGFVGLKIQNSDSKTVFRDVRNSGVRGGNGFETMQEAIDSYINAEIMSKKLFKMAAIGSGIGFFLPFLLNL